MRKMWFRTWMCGVALVLAVCLAQASRAAAPGPKRARNVILMIADGTGFNCFEAASYYQYGRLGQQPYDEPGWLHYACRTTPLSRASRPTGTIRQDETIQYDSAAAWDKTHQNVIVNGEGRPRGTGPFKGYNFLKTTYTDSAAAATALATGIKTYNTSIDFDNFPESRGQSLIHHTIAELFKQKGRSAGVITSVPWSHATPAALGGGHNISRNNYSAIANTMLHSRQLDLIMGGGHPEFDANGAPREPQSEGDFNFVGGLDTWKLLVSGNHPGRWTLVQTRDEFESLTSGPTPAKVVGTFQAAQTLQQQRQTRDWDEDGYVDAADRRAAPAFGDPFIPTVPTLQTMTRAALNCLNNRRTGFFLMIEGGAVDWANHNNQAGRMIEELSDFTNSIRAVCDWVEKNSSWDETLVIVTADHETGLLWGPQSDRIAYQPVVNNGAGQMPGLRYNTDGHSNSLVPLFVRGPGAKLFDRHIIAYDPKYGAYVDNIDIFKVMRAQLPPARRKANRPAGIDEQ